MKKQINIHHYPHFEPGTIGRYIVVHEDGTSDCCEWNGECFLTQKTVTSWAEFPVFNFSQPKNKYSDLYNT